MGVIGQREADGGSLAVGRGGGSKQEVVSVDEFVARLVTDVRERKLGLLRKGRWPWPSAIKISKVAKHCCIHLAHSRR